MSTVLGAVLFPLLLLIPGFVLVTVFRRNRHVPDTSDARFVAASLVASLAPHLLLGWWTRRIFDAGVNAVSVGELTVWIVMLAIVLPSLLGFGASVVIEVPSIERFLGRFGWNRVARTRSAWEWAFSPVRPGFLLITTRDGSRLGGHFGSKSFASLDPERRDVLISRPYLINEDGTFG